MAGRHWWRRWVLVVSSGGLMWVGGCLAAVEQGVGLVLSPNALGNALVAPFSPAFDVVLTVVRAVYG